MRHGPKGRQSARTFSVSFGVVIAGTEKKGTVLTDMEKRIVSYHEVGPRAGRGASEAHAARLQDHHRSAHLRRARLPRCRPRRRKSIFPAAGELLVELQTLLGGRAAEDLVFGIATTGASNDIERATDLRPQDGARNTA
ncbi:MAG: hypothetical protein ACLUN5_15180 [Oscillospiraceae bacterium]